MIHENFVSRSYRCVDLSIRIARDTPRTKNWRKLAALWIVRRRTNFIIFLLVSLFCCRKLFDVALVDFDTRNRRVYRRFQDAGVQDADLFAVLICKMTEGRDTYIFVGVSLERRCMATKREYFDIAKSRKDV